MTLTACIECGNLTEGARCDHHRLKKIDIRSARRRGYTTAWDRLSRRARRLQPFCTDCGATSNLETDHSPEAWERHDQGLPVRLQDVEVVCADCNRARGSARPWGVDPARTFREPPSAPSVSVIPPGGIL